MQLGMLRVIIRLHDRAQRAIVETEDVAEETGVDPFTWRAFRATHPEILDKVTQMKFLHPLKSTDEMRNYFKEIVREIDEVFDNMTSY